LPRDAADLALVAPATDEGVAWDPGALEEMYEVTGGYPYFVQAYGKAVWDTAPRTPISREDVVVGARLLSRTPQSLSPARDSLLKKGLVYSGERGRVAFTVPHFGRYLRTVG